MPVNPTIEQYLAETRLAIDNAHEPAIQEYVAAYGLDTDHLAHGLQVWTQASDAYSDYLDEHYERDDAIRSHVGRMADLRSQYVRHRKLLRVVFDGEDGILGRLRLNGRVPKAQNALKSTIRTTYETILNDDALLERAASVTITADVIEGMLADVAEVDRLARRRERETSEAETSTVTRDDALDELRGWMRDFWRITEVALEPSPQLKEMLGRTAP